MRKYIYHWLPFLKRKKRVGHRPKTTKFKLLLTAYKDKTGETVKLKIKCSDVKTAMFKAIDKLEKKGFDRIRLEEAKIGRKVIYENEEES